MAKYAKIVNSEVINVILADSQFISSQEGIWIEITDDTDSAGIGYSYDLERNKFVSPKPYASWILNTETNQWNAPIESPGNNYYWDENGGEWKVCEIKTV